MWIKQEGQPNLTIQAFTEGDLVNYWVNDKQFIGEIVDIQGTLHVHFLQANGKIWNFNEELTHHIHPKQVFRHLTRRGQTLTGSIVRQMWNQMGYEVGVHDYCLLQDVNCVSLDIGEESESEEESSDEMDDFIVPDDEGEAFCHPNPDHLTSEQKEWVQQTHMAVNEWNKWNPEDTQQQAIKSFVDNMSEKYSKQEDERQFTQGAALEYHTPPVKSYKH